MSRRTETGDADGEVVRARRMANGYAATMVRLHAATKQRDPEQAFFPLFEALNWATALDDLIAERWRPEGKRQGFDWRERVPGTESLDGVRYVRNRVHHQWADALRLEEGARLPFVLPAMFFSWIWRDVDDLPRAKRPDPRGQHAYEQHLANQRAEYTLRDLRAVFDQVLALLEPPRLHPGG